MAGVVGVDYRPLTWHELFHMYMGRQRSEWDRTSSIMAMLVNVNAKKQDRIKDPSVFNPFSLKSSAHEAEELLEMQERGEIRSNFSMKDLIEDI